MRVIVFATGRARGGAVPLFGSGVTLARARPVPGDEWVKIRAPRLLADGPLCTLAAIEPDFLKFYA